MLGNGDFKTPLFTGDALYLRKGQQLNIEMPADLDQFRREDSHGTVIGWEGLVQLGHNAPYGGGPFHQIDVVAGVGQIQSSLHSGNPSADNHY
jgi:hypothetical protein